MSFSDLDPDLVAAAIRGEREAVTALTQAYLPRVFGLALRLTRNREQAEEVTQETFVRALRNLTQLKNPARLTSWLLTITAKKKGARVLWAPDVTPERSSPGTSTVRQKLAPGPRAGKWQDWRPPAGERRLGHAPGRLRDHDPVR